MKSSTVNLKKQRRYLGGEINIERVYVPTRDAKLQALRVVLGLPRKPISLEESDNESKGNQ